MTIIRLRHNNALRAILLLLLLCGGCKNFEAYEFEYEIRSPVEKPQNVPLGVSICTQGELGSISGQSFEIANARTDSGRKVYGPRQELLYAGNRRYGLVLRTDNNDYKYLIFLLPIASRIKDPDWTEWAQPDYDDSVDAQDASFKFIYGRETRSSAVPSGMAFELRFRMRRIPELDILYSYLP
jgi:hypothetical protein